MFVRCAWKICHFKHLNINPECFKEHETEEHLTLKEKIYNILRLDKNNININFEYRIGDQIADVYCEHGGLRYAVECQCSHISKEDYDNRSMGWKLKNIYSMWIFGSKFLDIDWSRVNSFKIQKRLIKGWKHINFYLNGLIITLNNHNDMDIYKNPFIKPYLSIVHQNKSLIFVDLIPK